MLKAIPRETGRGNKWMTLHIPDSRKNETKSQVASCENRTRNSILPLERKDAASISQVQEDT